MRGKNCQKVVEMEGSQRMYVIRALKKDTQKYNPRKHSGHK